jgi:hypothetical protein
MPRKALETSRAFAWLISRIPSIDYRWIGGLKLVVWSDYIFVRRHNMNAPESAPTTMPECPVQPLSPGIM